MHAAPTRALYDVARTWGWWLVSNLLIRCAVLVKEPDDWLHSAGASSTVSSSAATVCVQLCDARLSKAGSDAVASCSHDAGSALPDFTCTRSAHRVAALVLRYQVNSTCSLHQPMQILSHIR